MVEYSRTARRAGSLVATAVVTWAFFVSAALAAAAAAPPPHYTVDGARSLLRFAFVQAGANNTGRFGKFTGDIAFAPDNLAASKLDVTIDVTSLDSGDKERDDTLKGPDLFDIKKFPQARFVATKFAASSAARFEAQGKLTIRNVTKDLKLPITFQTKTEAGKNVAYLTGRVTIKRLDYGVGQGDWKSTEWVNDNVDVTFSLRLLPAP